MEKRWGDGGIVRVSTKSERKVLVRATTRAGRAISRGSVQNRFEQNRVIQHQLKFNPFLLY